MPSQTKDPTAVEFTFTGDSTVGVRGIPARDLTTADVDRLVYRRTVPEPGRRGLRRGDRGFTKARHEVIADLLGTGKFTKGADR